MSESFNIQRFISLFVWSTNRKNVLLRIVMMIFVFVQIGWTKSKSTLDPIETMNIYIFTSLALLNFTLFTRISKLGVSTFLLLPATVFEKFLYAISKVFGGAFVLSFLVFFMGELSARLLFSVSNQWFAFDADFAVWMVFTTSILFFIQFVFLKRSNNKVWVIILSVIIFTANIFIDNYFIEHFAQFTSIRLLLYTLLSAGFIGAAYLQFVKCEVTINTKNFVLK